MYHITPLCNYSCPEEKKKKPAKCQNEQTKFFWTPHLRTSATVIAETPGGGVEATEKE